MTQSATFLRANWKKLIFANYKIDPKILQPYVPKGTEVDLWQDTAYVSYVGFLFQQAKVKGIQLPGCHTFPEFNLRFYVRFKTEGQWQRGVVFIKEIVPYHLVTWVANTLYGEHYQTLPMDYYWNEEEKEQTIEYRFRLRNDWNYIRVKASMDGMEIKPNSEAEYITQHSYGITRRSASRSDIYQVEHPRWMVYPMHQLQFGVNVAALYGPTFSPFLECKPVSTFLAEGSAVTVSSGKRLIQ
ncbi:MAG: DUF2071 domain-containing protein [Cytophagaceae bacterium]|jgi:hypothetical protein|nr:DUF2071 domain-containing protein [Cytophagaceae bacterium]